MKINNIPRYVLIILGLVQDESLAFRLVVKMVKYFLPRYKLTWPELAWFDSPGLNAVLQRFDELEGFNAHRRLAVQQLLRMTADILGDTAECGVYKGCSSYLILQANSHSSHHRIHHVFDSFEGLSAPVAIDGPHWRQNDLAMSEDVVKRNLVGLSEVRFYKGWIPDRFQEVAGRLFSFVHIDVDLYEPTLESVMFFYTRLNPGSILVCDDYGCTTCPGATAAVDEFLSSKPEKMILLPGGGGFFVKGVMTARE